MTDAYVIHAGEETAGIVVREPGGFHFFASLPRLFALEGHFFSGLGELHRAIDRLQRATGEPALGRVRTNGASRFHERGRQAA